MQDLLASIFTFAAVAFAAGGDRVGHVAGSVSGVVSIAVAVTAHGPLAGGALAVVLAMTAASVLVLLLSPRPRFARRFAWALAAAGTCLALFGHFGGCT